MRSPRSTCAPPPAARAAAPGGGGPGGGGGGGWGGGGWGGAAGLLAAVEAPAGGLGLTVLRLDTRGDLVEARALYARHGYREIPRYNDSRYADHWFEKSLPGPVAGVTPPAAS
ncbi:hypothetical protein GCM10009665_09110 [Kitasatospora nipponensis]|uniref:Acetyltransferase (GNAT) family protein n=1 Tax=Kitasatospora nipponensis TaxID=258049 RepID=A0ABP4GDC8_9ACTN